MFHLGLLDGEKGRYFKQSRTLASNACTNQLVRGPEFVGPEYGSLLEKFEKIARAVNVTHLREGGPDLDEKLDSWRKAWQEYQNQKP